MGLVYHISSAEIVYVKLFSTFLFCYLYLANILLFGTAGDGSTRYRF